MSCDSAHRVRIRRKTHRWMPCFTLKLAFNLLPPTATPLQNLTHQRIPYAGCLLPTGPAFAFPPSHVKKQRIDFKVGITALKRHAMPTVVPQQRSTIASHQSATLSIGRGVPNLVCIREGPGLAEPPRIWRGRVWGAAPPSGRWGAPFCGGSHEGAAGPQGSGPSSPHVRGSNPSISKGRCCPPTRLHGRAKSNWGGRFGRSPKLGRTMRPA